jgi:transketolase
MALALGPRRGTYIDITEEMNKEEPLSPEQLSLFEAYDLIYRSLCALLFNYVPTSGHPGGSISSGRMVAGILYDAMDYDFSNPDRKEADIISYAAGHKALGLYAMWALRNEAIRVGAPELLPKEERLQLRIEDLLGFRRNPATETPLFKEYRSKPLDGHPTPATPFLRLATGASGVGIASSLGLAYAAKDYYGDKAPRVHLVEGEGGLTPGRAAEALTAAGTASLENAFLHVDWNQASIDTNHVCRDDGKPGDYVQWNPMELAYFHDWNVVYVPDGKDFQQVIAGQRKALEIANGQPTAIVYRTTKGWQYGIEGKAAHGAGHKLCADGFFEAVAPFADQAEGSLPRCEAGSQRCDSGASKEIVEECFWDALTILRNTLKKNQTLVEELVRRIVSSRERLDEAGRTPRENAPRIEALYAAVDGKATSIPDELTLTPGTQTTLRAQLGMALNYLNEQSRGSVFAAAADLLGSTSINTAAKGFAEGYYNAKTNPEARLLSIGGICEDAMSGILAGLSTYGHHVCAGSSYGAFIAPLGHIAARLHAIGNQARREFSGEPYKPFLLVCAHAGIKTGEDGPTHADPQALQLLQGNFPLGTFITLTPWDPQDIWPLLATALEKRPAVVAPFVTRPNETILDREALGVTPPTKSVTGVYALRRANGKSDGTIVLQGSGVTYAFLEVAFPMLQKEGVDLNIYYISSAELFELLPESEQERIYPTEHAREAMGITGFTLPTMYKWIRSDGGIKRTLYPFRKGRFLGSGQAQMVLKEAEMDGESQFKAVMEYVKERK